MKPLTKKQQQWAWFIGLWCGGLAAVTIHDAQTGESVREIRHAPYTMHVAFSPDGRYVASGLRGSLNKWLGVFDVATGDHFRIETPGGGGYGPPD